MAKKTARRKIGYIDEESQWVDKFKLKLKEDFDIVTFKLTPNITLDKIVKQVIQAKLDCLVVDFELKEAEVVQFNGDEIINSLRSTHPHFPVFIITAKEEDDVLGQVLDNDIVRLKEELDNKLGTLIQRIQNKIETYYNQIENANSVIDKHIKKRNKKKLSIKEEEELSEAYLFLDKVYPEDKILPSHLIQHNNISKLNEFAVETRKILQELKKISK
jgi:DNA-binding NarL/FixJ family response regulator